MLLILKALFYSFAGLLLASFLLIAWGLFGQWILGQKLMLQHSEDWLQHERRQISDIVKQPRLVQSIQSFFNARPLAHWQLSVPNICFNQHGQEKSVTQRMLRFHPLLQNGWQRLGISGQIFCNLMQVALLRSMTMLFFLPLFGLFGFIGLIEGLAQRHLRKLQGARESSVLYQRIKTCLAPSLWGAGILYVGLPLCLNPLPLFLLFSLGFSLTLAMAARTYKKYL